MATNLATDDTLVEEARSVGGHKTEKEAVTALREYVEHRRQAEILSDELIAERRLAAQTEGP